MPQKTTKEKASDKAVEADKKKKFRNACITKFDTFLEMPQSGRGNTDPTAWEDIKYIICGNEQCPTTGKAHQ